MGVLYVCVQGNAADEDVEFFVQHITPVHKKVCNFIVSLLAAYR